MQEIKTTCTVTCDRCGKEIKSGLKGFHCLVRILNPSSYNIDEIDVSKIVDGRDEMCRIKDISIIGHKVTRSIDLCGQCNREFKEFLKNPKI